LSEGRQGEKLSGILGDTELKTSPARRVYKALNRAHNLQVKQNIQSIRAWAQVFGLQDDPSGTLRPEVEDQVLSLIRDLRFEVTEVERGVIGTEFAEPTAAIANAARNLTASTQIHSDWNQVKTNFLRPEFLAAWHWASMSLPSAEDSVGEETLEELRTQLRELQESIQKPDVPEGLRRFIERQIKSIGEALRRYDVCGTDPLEAAVSRAAGDLMKESETLKKSAADGPESGRAAMAAFGKVWTKAAKACGDLEKFRRGYDAITALYGKALPLLENLADSIDL
jgi:hypothetical protein